MILVVGGAGYIGSHIVNRLVETERVVVYDNLSTGCREAVNDQAIFIEGELADEKRLSQIFSLFPIEAVVHLAEASLEVEFTEDPQLYYETNVAATLVLLKAMRSHNVKNIIYSSTNSAYASSDDYLHEQSNIKTKNPYTRSKYFVEQILKDYTVAYKMNCTVLRYFNVPGTQIEALVNAYTLALETVAKNEQKFKIYNLGIGQGYSEKVTKEIHEIKSNQKENNKLSDTLLEETPVFIASLKKIQQELGLYAERNLQYINSDAWNDHLNKNLNF